MVKLYFLLVLLVISLSGAAVFSIFCFLERRFRLWGASFSFLLIKLLLVFFLLPGMFGGAVLLYHQVGLIRSTPIDSPDIQRVLSVPGGWMAVWQYSKNLFVCGMKTLFWIWLFGVLVSAIRGIWRTQVIQRGLSEAKMTEDSEAVCQSFHFVQKSVAMKRSLPVFYCDVLTTPVLYGVRKPRIFLDSRDYSQRELDLILLHEAIHWKRKDLWFKTAADLISILYWFHPLMKYIVREFYVYMELSCDEMVLKRIPETEHRMYAGLIGEKKSSFVSGFSVSALRDSQKHIIIRRLEAMTGKTKKNAAGMVLAALLMAVSSPLAVCVAVGVTAEAGMALQKILDSCYQTEVVMTEMHYKITYETVSRPSALRKVNSSGVSTADVTVREMEYEDYGYFNLKAGDVIWAALLGDSSSDKFKVGMIDTNGSGTFADSENGALTYTFKASKSGNYVIRIEGAASGTVHITGNIRAN